ncbi:MAG TPA: hypothetical protein VGO58_13535 [Chitinophagaceae bacterium]|jgi:hypothetical protein|nr:hypothetical protein [Chitinophagaceae bacterium]
MKRILIIAATAIVLFASGSLYAQPATTKMAAAEEPTVANVLKWTKETLPKMERLVPKLEKIKANNTGKPHTDAIRLLATVNHLKEINAKGAKLKAAEARRYFDLVAATVNVFYIDCQSHHGTVCCSDCINHGILGIWCLTNCFVAEFPGID